MNNDLKLQKEIETLRVKLEEKDRAIENFVSVIKALKEFLKAKPWEGE